MSLVINNNAMAANAQRNLTGHYGALADSTRKLSSGLRVETAADDAAGLAIRELMRADIAALNQGVRNANDGISLIQTADGALGIIDEKLIRMKELAEQAATGTYDSVQRAIIDSEYQQMASEITRIAEATDFNGIKLLDGSLSGAHNGAGQGTINGNTAADLNNMVQATEEEDKLFATDELGNLVSAGDDTSTINNNKTAAMIDEIRRIATTTSDGIKKDGAGNVINNFKGYSADALNDALGFDKNYFYVEDGKMKISTGHADGEVPGAGDGTELADAANALMKDISDKNIAAQAKYDVKALKDLNDSIDKWNNFVDTMGEGDGVDIGRIENLSQENYERAFKAPDGAVDDRYKNMFVKMENNENRDIYLVGTDATVDDTGAEAVQIVGEGTKIGFGFDSLKYENTDFSNTAAGMVTGADTLRDAIATAINAVGTGGAAATDTQIADINNAIRAWNDFVAENTPDGANASGIQALNEVTKEGVAGTTTADGIAALTGKASVTEITDMQYEETDFPELAGAVIGDLLGQEATKFTAEEEEDFLARRNQAVDRYNALVDGLSLGPDGLQRQKLDNVTELDEKNTGFDPLTNSEINASAAQTVTGEEIAFALAKEKQVFDASSEGELKVHFGPGNDCSEDYYYIQIDSATASALGVGNQAWHLDENGKKVYSDGHNISTQENAQVALEAITDAITSKDNIRAHLGALQNRLENTVSNLSIQSENLQAAESRISDIDVSKEMTNFVRNQTLSNAANSMLAQANQLPQMALQLIG